MPEMTADDLARIRRAVQLRDRCGAAAVADGERLGLPLSPVQANVAYDAMASLIRVDERARYATLIEYVRTQHNAVGLHDHMGADLTCHGCALLAELEVRDGTR